MTPARQYGFGLLEMLAVLVLGALLGGGVLALLDRQWEQARLHEGGRRHAELAQATRRYLDARRDQLVTALPANAVTALPLADLQAAGYLAASFTPQNAYGHSACVLLRRSGDASTGQVEALVGASGGQALERADLAEMAAAAGPGAGYLDTALPLSARGAFGTWTMDAAALQPYAAGACPGGALGPGRLASMLRQPVGSSGDGVPDYLARRGSAADAPWNVMDTPLAMGAGATASAGAACGAAPAIALDASRDLLSCAANGLWKRQAAGRSWKETKPNHGALPGGDAPGDVRMTADTGRAYVARAGNGWQALAIDQDGQLTVASQVRAGSLTVRGHLDADAATAGGTLKAGRDVQAGFLVNGDTVDARTRANAHANWVDRRDIVAGLACNLANQKVEPDGSRSTLYPIGTMMRDSQGVTLTCQSPYNQFRYQKGRMSQ